MRYRIGFQNESTKSVWTENNPGYPAIIDTEGPWAFGSVVALCDSKLMAEKIVALLNAAETYACP